MKTIGLIGGMSWESSLEYYRIINEKVKKELGGSIQVGEKYNILGKTKQEIIEMYGN